MSEVMDAIKARRCVRKFTSEPVAEDAVERIMEAGLWAPSGMNKQTAVVVAITDPEVCDRLRKANAAVAGMSEDADPFYGAPVVLVALARTDFPTYVYDGSLMMGNMLLAAHDEGLGACWIHRAKEEFQMPEWQEWLHSLGLEGEYEGIGHVALGHYEGDYPTGAPRNDGRAVWVR